MGRDYALSDSYLAVPDSVPLARRAITEVAAAAGAAAERLDEIRLAVSEALTNAVVHAYHDGPAGHFQVTAAVAAGELWVLISDDGRGLHASNDSRGLGLGLSLISGLSDDFAIIPRASGGTEVQMRFNLRKARTDWVRVSCEGRSLPLHPRPDFASRR